MYLLGKADNNSHDLLLDLVINGELFYRMTRLKRKIRCLGLSRRGQRAQYTPISVVKAAIHVYMCESGIYKLSYNVLFPI